MKSDQGRASQVACLILCGLGLGWLIGMSVSPVVAGVVGAVMATLLAVVGVLAGVEMPIPEQKKELVEADESRSSLPVRRIKPYIDVLPLTYLILGLVAGSIAGVCGRTHQWLAADPQAFMARWTSAGLTQEQARELLIRESYGPDEGTAIEGDSDRQKAANQESGPSQLASPELSAVLFSSAAPEECRTYQNLYGHGDELVRALAASSDERVRTLTRHLLEISSDPKIVEVVTRDLICASLRPNPTH